MSTPSVIVGQPVNVKDLTEAPTPATDDFLILDGLTAGTRKLLATRVQAETLQLKNPIALSIRDDISGVETLQFSNTGWLKWLPVGGGPNKVELVPDVLLEKLMIVVGGLHITGDLTVAGTHPLSPQLAALEARVGQLEAVVQKLKDIG